MDKNNHLIPVPISIIMHVESARTKANEVLGGIVSFDLERAKEEIREAREDITRVHQEQTEIIQAGAAGEQYTSCLLFTHAQDTLMTIMNEVNLTEKMVTIFENFYTGRGTIKQCVFKRKELRMSIVEPHKDRMQDSFSKDSLWGAAISAKQAEGNSDRALTVVDLQNYDPHDKVKAKGDLPLQEIMDRIEHLQDYTFPKKTGIDFYHRFRDDIKLLKGMRIECFRFSVSWAGIYPDGVEEKPGEKGFLLYDQLLDVLKKMDIEPIVALYHDSIPINLALKYNGFLHPRVVDLFAEYAVLTMKCYQHKVTYWIPVNRINLTRVGLSSIGVAKDAAEDVEAVKWQGVHHKFIACARIRKIGRTTNTASRFGAMLVDLYASLTTRKPENAVFATEKNQMTMLFFVDVQLCGEYPNYTLRYLKDNSVAIHADENELMLLKNNTLDFLAINYYSSNMVSYEKSIMAVGNAELNPYLKANPWRWTINPLGLHDRFLNYRDRYGKPLIVAENGFGQTEELSSEYKFHDDYRIDCIKEHIRALQKAVQHGVDVLAYCAWSPTDMVSFGTSEMKKRYGFIHNDQDDTGHRTQKWYSKDSYW